MIYPPFFFSVLFLLLAVAHAFPDIQRRATGDTACGTTMCISATVNGSTTSYVLSSLGGRSAGWMAIGFGSRMANTPMVIIWTNSDGTATLSQRKAPTEVMPTVDSSPPRKASFSSALSVLSSSKPSFAFTIPSNSDTRQSLIYAFGTTNPGSSSVSATLIQHYDYGSIQLDLTKDLASTPTGSSSPTSTGSTGGGGSIPLLPYQKIIVAHAVFCVLGFLFVLPSGVLLARHGRNLAFWFKGHATLQFFIAGPTILIGFVLGIVAVEKAGNHLDDDHKRWGIAIFVLYVAQCILGVVIHYVKKKNRMRRPPQNYFHAIFGLLVISLAFYQVRTGFNVEWPTTTGRDPLPPYVNILYWIWLVILSVAYAAGLINLPKQYRKERKDAQDRLERSNQHDLPRLKATAIISISNQ